MPHVPDFASYILQDREGKCIEGHQSNTITYSVQPQGQLQRVTRQAGATDTGPEEEPSRAALMEAIQGSREDLEGKIDTMMLEVGLLHADLRKVLGRVTDNEVPISTMGKEITAFKEQVTKLTEATKTLENRAEDAEGRCTSWGFQTEQRGAQLRLSCRIELQIY
ncbi:hypothetical protein NDU88_003045 [Pleurodeles waltl]|uniref:Uncharacterized protein n=1 Tax=Pleurodeles waltl TaxID=8319 RepID=A0AAV7KVW1_PLEWA|nr:hypothetical protein NDU88_003045 [Pleurodeles waltl]